MKYLLDTNVLSALMGSEPVPEVAAWLGSQPIRAIYTATICQAEILAGIAVLPPGRRRYGLEQAARSMFNEDFQGRIIPFDSTAAEVYAGLVAARRAVGLATPPTDLMIAAVASAAGAGIVTRDVRGFQGCGLTLVDPWAPS